MVSDQDLANSVESLFRHSDPNAFTSFNGVVQHLEAKLGLDLSDKVGFIRDQIELLFGSSPQPQPPPPPPKQQQHFDLQNHPQFQNTTHHSQIPSHFALQHQQRHHHHHHHEELNFGRPDQHHPNLQQHQQLTSSQSRSHHRTQKNAAPDGTKPSTPAKRRGGPGGLNKACGVSPELQAIVGEPTMTRTEIVKQLWAYIRKHNLQDPSNKRKIICNDELRLVFETDCTDMFKMNKLLSKHIIRLEPSQEESSREKKRAKVEVESVTESNEGGNSCSSPVGISEELAKFIDSESTEMPQSEALRRVWEYIQVHHLEDPMNPMVVICDGKLQELFGCEKISALGVTEMVGRHFSKQS